MRAFPLNRETILDFFFPKRCLGCGRIGHFVCGYCLGKLPYLEVQYCPVCNHPAVSGFTHLRCQRPQTADRLICLFAYRGLARELIQNLKYQKVTALKSLLVEYIGEFLTENDISLGGETVVTFVPSHPLKLLERGFNQSQLVAEELGRSLGLRVERLLDKIRETQSQTELSREERKKNVKGSFSLMSNVYPEPRRRVEHLVKGRDILLVDDVFTTGATLLECSKVLKKSGARFLYLLTLVRD